MTIDVSHPDVGPIAGHKPVNPYVGPRAFDTSEQRFFVGRDEEIKILEGQVMTRQVSLFFAQSGAGKSSLLRAGLIPTLTQQQEIGRGRRIRHYQKMRVLPVLTVGGGVPSRQQKPIVNLYSFNALTRLLPEAMLEDLAEMTLVTALEIFFSMPLSSTADGVTDPSTLLIFDQFEELFTHHLDHWREREAFFRQVNDALATYPTLHILFTMREDYIAELTPYTGLLPDQLRPRFRLERLKRDSAIQAVIVPAARAGRTFPIQVAQDLVDNLRQIQVGKQWHSMQTAAAEAVPLGDYIEPVHLQIVCRDLWEKLPADRTVIEADDVRDLLDVNLALIRFYESALAHVIQETGLSERRLRNWFTDKLITPAHTRGLVYRGETETEELPNSAVDLLNAAWIIRADLRGGDSWYELAHDRLVEPILQANFAWQATYRNPLVAATRSWIAAGRAPEKLLDGTVLKDAQLFAQAHAIDVLPEEKEYLDESLRQQTIRRMQEKQAIRRRRILLITAFCVSALLAMLTIWALQNAAEARRQEGAAVVARQQAQAQAQVAQSRELAAGAIATLETDPELSILLAQQAVAITYTVDAEDALRQALQVSRVLQRLTDDGSQFRRVAFSPDGSHLAAANLSGKIIIWQLNDPTPPTRVLTIDASPGGKYGEIRDLAYSPDGRRLATAHSDTMARIWDVTSGKLLLSLSGHALEVLGVEFSPDGKRLATAGLDAIGIVWDLSSGGKIRHELQGHLDGVSSITFSPSGKFLATAGRDNAVIIWDAQTGKVLQQLEAHMDKVHAVAFSPDETRLASASSDKTVIVWDITGKTASKIATLFDHTDTVNDVTFSPNGNCLATASLDRTGKVWDAKSGQLLINLTGHTDWVDSVAFRPMPSEPVEMIETERCGAQLSTASRDGTVRIWNIGPTYEALTLVGHTTPVESAVYSPDGTRIASGSDDGIVYIWDAKSGQRLITLDGHAQRVNRVVFSPDGKYLATASFDGTAKLWDTATGNLVVTLMGHEDKMESVAFGPNGTQLAAASDDGMAWLWRVPSGEAIRQFEHGDIVYGVAFSPDGQTLVTTGADSNVKLWEIASGEVITTLQHSGAVYDAAFNQAGTLLATISWDATVKLWMFPDGKPLHTLIGHTDRVYGVAFDPDGQTLITSSADRTARLWDVQSGQFIRTLYGPEFNSLSFHPDGQRLVIGGEDGTVRVYVLKMEQLMALAEKHLTRPLSQAECQEYMHQSRCRLESPLLISSSFSLSNTVGLPAR